MLPWIKHGVMPAACVALAVGVRQLLEPLLGNRYPMMFSIGAVVVIAWYARFAVVAAAIVMLTVLGNHQVAPPGQWFTANLADLIAEGAFLVTAFCLAVLCARARRLQREAERRLEELRSVRGAAQQKQRKLEEVLDNVSDMFVTLDDELRYTYVNERMVEATGLERAELLGKRLREVFPEAADTWLEQRLESCVQERKSTTFAHHYPRWDRWFDNRVYGSAEGLSIFTTEITARKRAEDQLERSRALLTNILDNMDASFIAVDAEWRIIFFNALCARLTGLDRDVVIGKTFWEVFPMHVGRPFERTLREAMNSRTRMRLEEPGPFSGRWFEVTLYPLADGICISTADIHERRVTQDLLRENEERLRLAIDAGKVGTWDWDVVSNRMTWSERCYDFFGVPPGGFSGTIEGLEALIHPADRERLRQLVREAGHGEAAHALTLRLQRPDGEIRWVATNGRFLKNAAGEAVRMLGAVVDVTDLRRSEEALRQAQDELRRHADQLEIVVAERTNELREKIGELQAFSYSVSHDLRSPLRAINGYAQALLEDYVERLEPTGVDYLRRIARAGERLDRLTQDVLTYGTVALANVQLAPVDLAFVIREVVGQYEALQPSRAEIVLKLPLPPVLGHDASLTQCVSNLLGNAVKFVAPNQRPTVEIWTEPRGDRVRLFFRDNGIGIAAEHHQRIFGIFERVHPANVYPGTGIGLAVVAKAVKRMGGQVGLQSEAGRGATFWIELTLAP